MKKLGMLVVVAILGSMMALNLAAGLSMISTVHAKPLPHALEAADLDKDGNVTMNDLLGFMSIYGSDSSNPNWNSPISYSGQTGWRNMSEADFNNNSRIDLADLVTICYCFQYNETT